MQVIEKIWRYSHESRDSKDRQYNDQKKKEQRSNNDLQNNTQKTKVEKHEPHKKPRAKLGTLGGVSS